MIDWSTGGLPTECQYPPQRVYKEYTQSGCWGGVMGSSCKAIGEKQGNEGDLETGPVHDNSLSCGEQTHSKPQATPS
jgi:hypothetical protein